STGTLTSRSVNQRASTRDHASAPAPAAARYPRARRDRLMGVSAGGAGQSPRPGRSRSRPGRARSRSRSSRSRSLPRSRSSSQPRGALPRPFHLSHGSGSGPSETLSVMMLPFDTRAPAPIDWELMRPLRTESEYSFSTLRATLKPARVSVVRASDSLMPTTFGTVAWGPYSWRWLTPGKFLTFLPSWAAVMNRFHVGAAIDEPHM